MTKLWPVQALACSDGGDGRDGDGGATKNIIPLKFSNVGDIIMYQTHLSLILTFSAFVGVEEVKNNNKVNQLP